MSNIQETIYSANRNSSSPLVLLNSVFRELPEAHNLGWQLFKRNIRAMYRQSLLGFFWALLPPLVTAAIWLILRSGNVLDVGDTNISYPVFVLCGTMLWQIFAESVQSPIKSVIANRSMLVKMNIPKTGLILLGLYEVGFNALIKVLIMSIVVIYFQVPIGKTMLLAPVGMVAIAITGIAFGLLLTPIGLLYKDIQSGIAIVLPFLMYLTPVVYPAPQQGIIATVMKFNPMATFINTCRDWITSQPVPEYQPFLLWTLLSIVMVLIGLIIYKVSMPIIIERIGA